MKLTDKYYSILAYCHQQGYIILDDLNIIYNFFRPKNNYEYRKLNRIKFNILINLESHGYLKRVDNKLKWELTEKGINALKIIQKVI